MTTKPKMKLSSVVISLFTCIELLASIAFLGQIQLVESSNWSQVSVASSSLPFTPVTTLKPALISQQNRVKSSILAPQSASRDSAKSRPDIDRPKVCQVNDGESVAIVEIEESRGSDISQSTKPFELPISGSVERGEIELKIESETHKYFHINNKRLQLSRPLNRDAVLADNSSGQFQQQAVTSIYLQVSCLDKRLNNTDQPQDAPRKVIVPVLVKVIDINDNPPKFSAPKLTVQVSELAPIGTILVGAEQLKAIDVDSANNGLVEYSLLNTSQQQQQQQKHLPPPPTTATSTTTTARVPQPSRPVQVIDNPRSQLLNSNSNSNLNNNNNRQYPTHRATINLHSEPIINGPMEDKEEEESDESLLASLMNSTEPSTSSDIDMDESESDDSSLAMLGFSAANLSPPRSRGRLVRSKRNHPIDLSSTTPDAELLNLPQTSASLKVSDYHHSSSTLSLESDSSTSMSQTTSPRNTPFSTTTTLQAATKRSFGEQLISAASASSQQLPWTNLMAVNDNAIHNAQHLAENDRLGPTSAQLTRDSGFDSTDFFALELTSWGPVIRLKKQLDFEARQTHELKIVATDRANNQSERLSSTATIVIRVLDGDDQGPAFVLDQGGCATNSIPPQSQAERPTTSASGLFGADSASRSATDLIGAASSHSSARQLNGLKVTDLNDDFDFSDSADRADRAEHQASSLASLPMETGHSRASSSFNGAPSTARPADYSCLGSSSVVGGSDIFGSGVAEYFGSVMAGDSDQLVRILPQAIKARDRDQLNAPIRYSFVNGTPSNYSLYFQINPLDAWVKQIAPIDRQFGKPDKFVIWLEAQEQSQKKHSTLARLTIDVSPADWSPPILVANSQAGFVDENSPISTRVWATSSSSSSSSSSSDSSTSKPTTMQYMQISILESNNQPSGDNGKYSYEFETTSDAFKVDKDGFVYVNQSPLDADSGKQPVFMFQVTARLAVSNSHRHAGGLVARSISNPISINVTLLDVNDNGPVLANNSASSSPSSPIKLSAISQAGISRLITTIQVDDQDVLPQNTRAKFSLVHVSNAGRDRFRLDESSGELRALGKFISGEQFSLTVQASDDFGRSSQSILDIIVVPGANTGAPQFISQSSSLVSASNAEPMISSLYQTDHLTSRSLIPSGDFSTEIVEALAPQSAIFQLHAQDPENDPISYSIIGGNINNDFYINSKSGTIYLQNKLDREEVSRYHLLVQARDSGGLSTTRSLKITVLDTNDENPVFTQSHYEFSVSEGASIGTLIGRIRAIDGDAGENGQVSYSIEATPSLVDGPDGWRLVRAGERLIDLPLARPIFGIDKQTGDITLLERLDFEKVKTLQLIAKAQDHDKNPRSTLADVTVTVLDVQDELPYFQGSQLFQTIKVWENRTFGDSVAHVKALDPDSVEQVTYELKWSSEPSSSNLFSVDAQSGSLQLNGRLDFEHIAQYTLLIGTVENQVNSSALADWSRQLVSTKRELTTENTHIKSPICRIDIQVLDLNDNAPQFVSNQLMPIRVKSSIALGTQIARLDAKDEDGSEPNNLIRYELVEDLSNNKLATNNDYCHESFLVDPNSGSVNVKSDLRRQSESECQLEIRAQDMGQLPASLSSQATLTVFIDHIAELPTLSSMIGFADSQFTIEIDENPMPNSLIKIVPIVNKLKIAFPLTCEIVSGNELGKFRIFENQDRDCEIRLRENESLDFEQQHRYSLMIRLNTIGSITGSPSGSSGNTHNSAHLPGAKLMAQVNVNVLDRNDNRPAFKLPSRYAQISQGKFLAAISSAAPPDTQVIQVRASDLDSPTSNGLISYELLNGVETESLFKVDPIDGIIRTSRPIEDFPQDKLPLRLKLAARDNPDRGPQESLESIVDVLVNIIEDRHRFVLVLKDTPASRTLDAKSDLLNIIQERSGFISGLERVESLKIKRNNSFGLESDVNGTDLWFYLIEPGSYRLVANDDPRVRQTLLDQRAKSLLGDIIQQTLGIRDAQIRLPYYSTGLLYQSSEGIGISGATILQSLSAQYSRAGDRIGGLLIFGAIFMAFIGITILIFQCGSKSASSRQDEMSRSMNKQIGKLAADLMQHPPNSPQTYFLPFGQQPNNTMTNAATYESLGPIGSAFSTSNNQQHTSLNPICSLNSDHSLIKNRKEYETQMLKMAVIFDDNNSVEDQTLNELNVRKDFKNV